MTAPTTPLPEDINASTMVIRSQRGWWRHALDIVLTVTAWASFIYLWGRGLHTVLTGKDIDGFDLPWVQQLLPTLHDFSAYIVAILLQGLLLLLWARYNASRFRHRQRRTSTRPLEDQNLLRDYGVAPSGLAQLRRKTVSTIHHTRHGKIVQITSSDPQHR
ncbi:poly-beta-1,6-N-acetyl-D-glucosamine biosynthesis protein PgaD [Comamonas sp.]